MVLEFLFPQEGPLNFPSIFWHWEEMPPNCSNMPLYIFSFTSCSLCANKSSFSPPFNWSRGMWGALKEHKLCYFELREWLAWPLPTGGQHAWLSWRWQYNTGSRGRCRGWQLEKDSPACAWMNTSRHPVPKTKKGWVFYVNISFCKEWDSVALGPSDFSVFAAPPLPSLISFTTVTWSSDS